MAAPISPDNHNKRSRQDTTIEPRKDYQLLAMKNGLSKQEAATLCVEANKNVKTQVVEGNRPTGPQASRIGRTVLGRLSCCHSQFHYHRQGTMDREATFE